MLTELKERLYSFYRNLRYRNKKYTTTETGDQARVPNISREEAIIRRTMNNEKFSLQDINIILSDYLDVPAITSKTHKLRETFINDTLWMVDHFHIHRSSDDKRIVDISLTMSEEAYGLKVTVTIPANEFHEVFVPFQFQNQE